MPSCLLLQLLLPLTSRTFQTPDGRPRPGPATPQVPLDPSNSQDLTLSSTPFPKSARSQGFPILGSPRPRTKHPGDTPLSLFPKSISPQAPVPVPSSLCPHSPGSNLFRSHPDPHSNSSPGPQTPLHPRTAPRGSFYTQSWLCPSCGPPAPQDKVPTPRGGI